MEHVTTPETAQRLKMAGFPQPETQFGQIWYAFHPDTKETIPVLIGSAIGYISENLPRVFAPTATDILRELGGEWVFAYNPDQKCFVFHDGVNTLYKHTNPAESAALAWLDKHEKENG